MSMPVWLSNLFSLTKEISSKVALPIFIATFVLLFLPDAYSQKIGLDQFRDAYRIWVGVLLLLTGAALITNAIWAIAGFLRPKINTWLFVREKRKTLRSLTADEKAILRRFIIDGEASVHANLNSGPINLLEHKQIVTRAADVSVRLTIFSYIMQPWAREYLERKRDLLN